MAARITRTRSRQLGTLLCLALLLSQAHAASIVYEYDNLGRLKSATFDGATRIVYALDDAGNRTQVTTLPGGALRIAAASYSVSEGAGTVSITVQRVGSTSGAASVTIATSDGTAVAGSDYVQKSQNLSWASGNAANKTFAVTITQDAQNEGSQTFNVTLSNAAGGWIGTPGSTIVTILDDDAASAGTLQFTSAGVTVAESAGTASRSVSRTGGSNGAVSVVCSTSDATAVAGADYVAKSVTLNWANGNTANKACTISILDDFIVEPTETFTLTLSPAVGAALGATTSATVTITDDDLAIPGIPGNLRANPTGIVLGGNYSVLWDTPTGSPSYYVLQETRQSDGAVTNYTINAPTVSKAFTKGNIEDIFTYRCRACNSANECSVLTSPLQVVVCMTGGCQ